MPKHYFHLTSIENTEKIIRDGIRSDEDGYIYLMNINSKVVQYHIAINQVFIDQYALFKINERALNAVVEKDNVAEITSKYQCRVKQNLIPTNEISFMGEFDADKEFLSNALYGSTNNSNNSGK